MAEVSGLWAWRVVGEVGCGGLVADVMWGCSVGMRECVRVCMCVCVGVSAGPVGCSDFALHLYSHG